MRRRRAAVCRKKCSRGKDTDVVQYYKFEAAHCSKAKMNTWKQKNTVSKIASLFAAHGVDRLNDMSQPIELAASSGTKRLKCDSDLRGCVDFSFKASEGNSRSPTYCQYITTRENRGNTPELTRGVRVVGCTFASLNQLSALIRAGPDGYLGITDYMQKRAQAYGLPNDCIQAVDGRFN